MPEYTVRTGDTLTTIAHRLRTTWQNLFSRNRQVIGPNPNNIKAGQRLAYGPLPTHVNLPPKRTPTPAPKPTAPGGRATASQIVINAIHRAVATTSCVPGECDHYTCGYYGLTYSGYTSAAAHFAAIPATYKHGPIPQPPAGAMCFWTGGSQHYGHAALSLGHGLIRCTDMDANGNYVRGVVSTIPLTDIHSRWGLTYVGATDAYAQGRLIAKVF